MDATRTDLVARLTAIGDAERESHKQWADEQSQREALADATYHFQQSCSRNVVHHQSERTIFVAALTVLCEQLKKSGLDGRLPLVAADAIDDAESFAVMIFETCLTAGPDDAGSLVQQSAGFSTGTRLSLFNRHLPNLVERLRNCRPIGSLVAIGQLLEQVRRNDGMCSIEDWRNQVTASLDSLASGWRDIAIRTFVDVKPDELHLVDDALFVLSASAAVNDLIPGRELPPGWTWRLEDGTEAMPPVADVSLRTRSDFTDWLRRCNETLLQASSESGLWRESAKATWRNALRAAMWLRYETHQADGTEMWDDLIASLVNAIDQEAMLVIPPLIDDPRGTIDGAENRTIDTPVERTRMTPEAADSKARELYETLKRIDSAAEWGRQLGCDHRTARKISTWHRAKNWRTRRDKITRTVRPFLNLSAADSDRLASGDSSILNQLATDEERAKLRELPNDDMAELLALIADQQKDDTM
ncbi:MAG: hypothetical protein ACK5Q5_17840 [Planctomycetaceae bacterium]